MHTTQCPDSNPSHETHHAVAAGDDAPVYLVDRQEFSFLLWDQLQIGRLFLGRPPFQHLTREGVEALLDEAQAFAEKLAACYRESDRSGAWLREDGEVIVPAAYHGLWQEFRRDWSWIRRMGEQCEAAHPARIGPVPPIVVQLISEMFMGANPAFMTYGGFTAFALRLIEQHGSESQKRLFLGKLASDEWDACYCATETQAGSDLSAIATSAEPLGEDVYAIRGHKRYITAGLHPLTTNTVCVVIARVQDPGQRAFSLSCFLVPRYWPDENGRQTENHVRCTKVEDKMGFNGCANTHLEFGTHGITRGYLLGNRRNVALPQLVTLMRSARISTGQFGVAMASSAYLHSLRHARRRVQGRRFTEAADASAAPVPIVEHLDVQRMLLDMRTKVEGCRGLIAKLVMQMTAIEALGGSSASDREAVDRHRRRVLLYTPIVKAYVSDEAWRVATTAIQVHGGAGYLREAPIEQYARDIKVLSIWEGTNYMQAQDLVRDKLNYGRDSILLRAFEEDIDAFLALWTRHPSLAGEFAALESAVSSLKLSLRHIRYLADQGEFLLISQFCTRVLEMFAEVIVGWALLEAGVAATQRLREAADANERVFLEGKLKSVQFYMHNSLPAVQSKAGVLQRSRRSYIEMRPDEFGFLPHGAEPTAMVGTEAESITA